MFLISLQPSEGFATAKSHVERVPPKLSMSIQT